MLGMKIMFVVIAVLITLFVGIAGLAAMSGQYGVTFKRSITLRDSYTIDN